MTTLAEGAEETGEHSAAWSDEDDWTRETLRLVRDLRTPHRRKRTSQIAYAVYCVALLLAVWGGLPSLGLFLEKSMGADYSGHGPAILAALPAGSCALGLGWLLVASWDAQWRGPVVPPRETVDWLLAQPVNVARVLRPWFWGSAAIAGGAGLLVSVIGMIALGLTVGVGLPAAFGWCLLGGIGLPLLATALATAVEGSERVARWARLATPYVAMAVLALVAQTVLAVRGDRLPGLERRQGRLHRAVRAGHRWVARRDRAQRHQPAIGQPIVVERRCAAARRGPPGRGILARARCRVVGAARRAAIHLHDT